MLLENLPLMLHPLQCSQRLNGFLRETLSRLTSDLSAHQGLLGAFLKGVGVALAAGVEDLEVRQCLERTVGGAYGAVWADVERLRGDEACSADTLLRILEGDTVWREMARCLTLAPSQVRSSPRSVFYLEVFTVIPLPSAPPSSSAGEASSVLCASGRQLVASHYC